MKNFKTLTKVISLILCLLLVFSMSVSNTFAETYSEILGTKVVNVIEIIDGDAIKVKVLETGEIARIKLLGVDARGYNGGIDYLRNTILGANVVVSTDNSVPTPIDGWNILYVTYNGININKTLIDKGYAVANASHSSSGYFDSLISAQDNAKYRSTGIWDNGSTNSSRREEAYRTGYINDNVNINTANASTLADRLSGVDRNLADEIIKYREKNPFNTVSEIKFVKGFDRRLYDLNVNIMAVSTNINRASREELLTLGNIEKREADDIIDSRDKKNFTTINQLRTKDLITQSLYNKISKFITTEGIDTLVDYTVGTTVVNANTASYDELVSAGMSREEAQIVVNYRKNGYTYKTLMELGKLPGINLTEKELNYLEDNVHVFTDINNCKDSELRSIFRSMDVSKIREGRNYNNISDLQTKGLITNDMYNDVKDILYTGTFRSNRVNINTATAEQMQNAGFSSSEAAEIINKRKFLTSDDLSFDLKHNNTNAALYTNVNTASQDELKSLNNGITSDLVDRLLNYRNDQPFGSYDELEEFFNDNSASSVYNSIKEYIVFR